MMKRDFKIFSDDSHPDLFMGICKSLSKEPGKIFIKTFSNGNIINRIDEDIRGFNCFMFSTQAPPVSENILKMYQVIRNLKRNSDGKITLVYGYMPWIRSDKEDQPRIAQGARDMADLITLAGVDRVVLIDPHFPQIIGYFDPNKVKVEILKVKPIFCNLLKGEYDLSNVVCVAADIGESKETGSYADRLGLPVAILDKRRVGNNEKSKYVNVLGDIEGKECILFDDEATSCGTLFEAIEFIIKHNVISIRVFVTHPVLSKIEVLHKILEIEQVKEMVITDVIPVPANKRSPKLKIVSMAETLARVIAHVHKGLSIRGKGGLSHKLYDPKLFPSKSE